MNQRKFFPDVAPEFGAIPYRPLIESIVVLKMSDLFIIAGLGFHTANLTPLDFSILDLKIPIRVDSGLGCSQSLRGASTIAAIVVSLSLYNTALI